MAPRCPHRLRSMRLLWRARSLIALPAIRHRKIVATACARGGALVAMPPCCSGCGERVRRDGTCGTQGCPFFRESRRGGLAENTGKKSVRFTRARIRRLRNDVFAPWENAPFQAATSDAAQRPGSGWGTPDWRGALSGSGRRRSAYCGRGSQSHCGRRRSRRRSSSASAPTPSLVRARLL